MNPSFVVRQSTAQRRSTWLSRMAVLLFLVASVSLADVAAANAAGSITVRGTVSCDGGKKVVGVWVNSSSGGSRFATWTAFPGRPDVATYSKALSTTLPTKLRIDVGCGGTASQWGSNNKSATITMSSGASRSINAWCGAGTCRFGNRENNTPAAPSNNPAAGKCWCTWRAADFWKSMTGRYPNWGGDAHKWDDNAAATGWSTSSFARPRSLFVSPPTSTVAAGHVGYVSEVRIVSGKVQIRISDRNANASCRNGTQPVYDRTDVWIDVKSGTRFIVPPPAGAI